MRQFGRVGLSTMLLSLVPIGLQGLVIPPTHLIYHHPVRNKTFFLNPPSDTIRLSLLLIDYGVPPRPTPRPTSVGLLLSLVNHLLFHQPDLVYLVVLVKRHHTLAVMLPVVNLWR